jgi:hypothetical protein
VSSHGSACQDSHPPIQLLQLPIQRKSRIYTPVFTCYNCPITGQHPTIYTPVFTCYNCPITGRHPTIYTPVFTCYNCQITGQHPTIYTPVFTCYIFPITGQHPTIYTPMFTCYNCPMTGQHPTIHTPVFICSSCPLSGQVLLLRWRLELLRSERCVESLAGNILHSITSCCFCHSSGALAKHPSPWCTSFCVPAAPSRHFVHPQTIDY